MYIPMYPYMYIGIYMTSLGIPSIVRFRFRALGAQPPFELNRHNYRLEQCDRSSNVHDVVHARALFHGNMFEVHFVIGALQHKSTIN